MKKYKTGGWEKPIEEVKVIKETAKFVILKGWNGKERRDAKASNYYNYFDTWKDAHQFLIKKSNMKIKALTTQIEYEKKKLKEIMELKS